MKRPLRITVIGLASLALFAGCASRGRHDGELQKRAELLRNAASYRADTVPYRFTYVQDTVHAREIRDYFRLDTLLGGNATTWENTLAVARFVSSNIPHENQQVYPERRDAVGLWEYTREVEPAFNCRLHAILLHELLLASGITNRFVTCLPADSLDQDCHVVNIVWLPEQRKWAMIDSDMQAWVTDPDGTPLSLHEMRRRTIEEAPMVVHPLLAADPGDDYLAYWAKNLYWFMCWEQTDYGKENRYDGHAVVLLPPGFEGFYIGDDNIRTRDEERYWAAPDTVI